ncbi:MAG: hypothetical protein C5B59_17120 [Bacteroidetes bacterium]|nr:MAG: hypothetical protein C5B59_17120 [Bacteroidota bacterium]
MTGKERQKLGLLIFLDIAISVADIVFLALLLFIIQLYTQPSRSASYSFLPSWLRDQRSILPIAIFFLLFSIKNLVGFLIYRAQCKFIGQTSTRLSSDKLQAFLEGEYANYINVDSAIHIRKIINYPIEFCQHILGGIQQIVTQTTLIILTITAMLIFNAKLFLFLFIILLPPIIAVFYLVKRKLRSSRMHSKATGEHSLQHLKEALSGFVESNIYNKNDFFLSRFLHWQTKFNKHIAELLVLQGLPNRVMEVFALLGLFALVAFNHWAANNGSTIIMVGAFIAAAYKIIPGIVRILNLSGQIRAYEFTIADLQLHPRGLPNTPTNFFGKPIRSLRFDDVSFRFSNHDLLKNLNFKIGKGDFLGITGDSGKGKTTILNLLLGFLTQTGGTISINDKIANTFERQQYWQQISYIKQQPFLIHDTILRNIVLDEVVNDDKLHRAVQSAGLTELLNTYPEKLRKVIAENGRNISGGQRQRIAIARALYKDASLIILDEPFSELDESAEQSLLQRFKVLSQEGRLVILITHNRDSLLFCNKIVSLDMSDMSLRRSV